MFRITSRRNPTVTHIKNLAGDKSYRRNAGEMLCEGPKMLREAITSGAVIRNLVLREGGALPENLPEIPLMVEVPQELLTWLADTKTPQELLFTCQIPVLAPPKALTGRRYLVLDGLQDPGNLGTIWRTADAFGAEGIFLLNHCADPWSPKTLRATMGACFRLPLWETTLEELKRLLDEADIPLIATALGEDSLDLSQAALNKAAVVIGSEGRGVSLEVLEAAKQTVKIPMAAHCESLNAAMAATVVLWEMAKP